MVRWVRCLAGYGLLAAAGAVGCAAQDAVSVASPDGRNVVTVQIHEGELHYAVDRGERKVVLPSRLGFEFRDAPPLRDGLEIAGSARASRDEQVRSEREPVEERARDHRRRSDHRAVGQRAAEVE